MNFYIDGEWNGYKGELISMALVPEDATANFWYMEFVIPTGIEIDPWVAKNVMPSLDGYPCDRDYAQSSLQQYLSSFDSVNVIADWPEDIERFCELLITDPGERISTPPLTMEIRRDLDSEGSKQPHNALDDAIAIRNIALAKARGESLADGEGE